MISFSEPKNVRCIEGSDGVLKHVLLNCRCVEGSNDSAHTIEMSNFNALKKAMTVLTLY